MTKIQVKAQTGGEAGEIDLSDELFNAPVNEQVVRVCYNQYRANQRAGTHSAKTRGHVSGGGKKPWRQKGTGRARAGSSRSPLWRGGAVIFGPLPRDYSYRVNKKVKRSAILSLLSARRQEGALIVVDDLAFESPKTKQFVQVLQSVGAGDARRVLVVGDSTNENLRLSAPQSAQRRRHQRQQPQRLRTADRGSAGPYARRCGGHPPHSRRRRRRSN
jgi:large subunit ribosomal protein L4